MGIASTTLAIGDGGLGTSRQLARPPAIVGCSSSGTAATAGLYSSIEDAIAAFGYGKLTALAAEHFASAGGERPKHCRQTNAAKTYDGNNTASWTSGVITASGFASGEGANVTKTSGSQQCVCCCMRNDICVAVPCKWLLAWKFHSTQHQHAVARAFNETMNIKTLSHTCSYRHVVLLCLCARHCARPFKIFWRSEFAIHYFTSDNDDLFSHRLYQCRIIGAFWG